MIVDQRGYPYLVGRKSVVNSKIYWLCCKNKNKSKFHDCSARAVSQHHKIIKFSGKHNHPPPEPDSLNMCAVFEPEQILQN